MLLLFKLFKNQNKQFLVISRILLVDNKSKIDPILEVPYYN